LGHRVDVVRADAEELAVTVAARQARRELRLRLPDPAPSSRLLRGEFERRGASVRSVLAPARLSQQQPPIIAPDGLSVAALWLNENAAYVQRVDPYRATLPPPKIARWGKRKHLLAACLRGRHFAGLLTRPEFLDPWQLPSWRSLAQPPALHLNAAPGQARLLRCVDLAGADGQRHLLLWSARRLLCWSARESRDGQLRTPSLDYKVLAEQVLAMVADSSKKIVYLRRVDDGVRICRFDGHDKVLLSLPCQGDVGAGHLSGKDWGESWQGDVAVEFRAGQRGGERHSRWRVWRRNQWHGKQDFELALSADWKVIGLAPTPDDGPGLIALDPERRAVVRIGERERRTLYASPRKISVASVAAAADTIALIDVSGRLAILRHQGRDVLVYEGGDD